eukprot:860787-Alexandrium_andersonii.AAC.1
MRRLLILLGPQPHPGGIEAPLNFDQCVVQGRGCVRTGTGFLFEVVRLATAPQNKLVILRTPC